MTAPLVSIVIPTYNQPALLLQTLDSVLAQTFCDYEIIIVDDGSTDQTVGQLQRLIELHQPKIRLFTQQNQGIGPARNRGIDEARGKYVALLDHDDLWMPEKLRTQVEFMERHRRVVAAAVPFAFSDAPTVPAFDRDAVADPQGIVEHPLRAAAQGHNFTMTSTLIFDREKARGLRHGIVRGVVEDVQFQIGLLARGPFGIPGDQILAIYRIHEGNFSRRADFYVGGIHLLRQLDKKSAFSEVAAEDRPYLLRYIAGLGRGACIKDLICGNRWRGVNTYIGEFKHQLRQRRFRFLLSFPLLLLAPGSVVNALATRGKRRELEFLTSRARSRRSALAPDGTVKANTLCGKPERN